MSKENPYDEITYKDKNKVYNEFKPYILEVKDFMINCINYTSSFNLIARVGEVVKIIINDDYTKNAIKKILLGSSYKIDGSCSLMDINRNVLNESNLKQYIYYVPYNLLNENFIIDNLNSEKVIKDKPIIIFDEPDTFLNEKTKIILNSTIKFLTKNHIVLVFTKLNIELDLNEKIIDLRSYDKANISEDIVYNLH